MAKAAKNASWTSELSRLLHEDVIIIFHDICHLLNGGKTHQEKKEA
jgi:Zn-dependent oligopeptidase